MQFSCNFNIFYFHQYLSYKYDQVVKRHLFDHTNPSARIICARAHLRARCAPRKFYHVWKIRFFEFYGSYWRARSARGSARAPEKILYLNSAHQNEQKKALAFFHMGIFVFRGGGSRPFWKMVNIFTYTCPNHLGVSAIDNSDRFEHVLHPYRILEVLEKNFRDEILIVHPQKWAKNALFWCFKAFISNFLYYNLYWGKLEVITRPQCVIRFFIRPLDVFLDSCEKP